MNVPKSMKCCVHLLRQRGWIRSAQHLGTGNAVRNYRMDDKGWVGDEDSEVQRVYGEENTFDPRYNDRHYKIYRRHEMTTFQDSDARRRRIVHDAEEHQRRQERILLDNKNRWEQRTEPKSPAMLNYEHKYLIEGKSRKHRQRQTEEERIAEEYSRQRRYKRLSEVKRQARELRESRKGYKLPKPQLNRLPAIRSANEKWLEQRAVEDEAKYWHTWTTCPNERRCRETAAANDADDAAPGDRTINRRTGFVQPKVPYDSSVRRYQTDSQQLAKAHSSQPTPSLAPPGYTTGDLTHNRRRPTGIEKQYRRSLNWGAASAAYRLPISRLKYPTRKFARFVRPKGARKSVQPPRYRLSIRANRLQRQRTPIDSFSRTLAVSTRYTPYTEYTGYARQTVCDMWQNFTAAHNVRPIEIPECK
ncbi:uncharacterized protein LOC6568789 [Drosophila grimshawi]|uniref:GH22713 n=1 Tax=Drosophila grimshawi TaxID=7222 RepID=B4JWM5_DROGR|nr:uncharacterized protein LOC6568789 [Drosophila grimshawi]EDV98363.1 GH22713 [Drosophila grimshawi]